MLFYSAEQLETPTNQIDDVIRLARQCRLQYLIDRLEDIKHRAAFFRQFRFSVLDFLERRLRLV